MQLLIDLNILPKAFVARLYDAQLAVRDFMELGGPVLMVIALTILVMWILIAERFVYFQTDHKRLFTESVRTWEARAERRSWQAHRIREALVSRLEMSDLGTIPLIRALVKLCPLLGLLGTVTGMIEVFDVLAFSSGGNVRSMAAGVSKATVPTMAGMVGALSGIFASTLLAREVRREAERLDESLTLDH